MSYLAVLKHRDISLNESVEKCRISQCWSICQRSRGSAGSGSTYKIYSFLRGAVPTCL